VRFEEREIRWTTWDGEHEETLRLGFENGGWTAEGTIEGLDITYVLRFDEQWRTRQFLLFRDLDEPDLWLATDGAGLWGETNGAVRDDLSGCSDIALSCTPFTTAAAVMRLRANGEQNESLSVAMVDVETLGVTVHQHHLTHLGNDQWEHRSHTTGRSYQFLVDEFGLTLDEPERFRRSDR
jgi:uncharacterized protein